MISPRVAFGSLVGFVAVLSCVNLVRNRTSGSSNGVHHRNVRQLLGIDPRSVRTKRKDALQCFNSDAPLAPEDANDAFRGHTIYMLGDSTIRQQFHQLCRMMDGSINLPSDDHVFRKATLIEPLNEDTVGNRAEYVRLCQTDSTRIAFAGTNQHGLHQPGGLSLIHDVLAKHDAVTGEQHRTKPTVVYVNGGLHYVQLRPYWFHKLFNWATIETFTSQFVEAVNSMFGPSVRVIYMKSHAMCEEKYTKEQAEAVKEFMADPVGFSKPCVDYVDDQKRNNGFPSNADSLMICQSSMLTTQGVYDVNSRITKTLAQPNNLDLPIGCVDGFEATLGKCDETRDGKHYEAMVRYELMSLAQSIHSVNNMQSSEVRVLK
mmetsp:Transcript_529/g.757  ORF Transcript_529/g.757 Transcript_529/m.757 type:complete len:374 (+) Transcript_529:3-1124(+)